MKNLKKEKKENMYCLQDFINNACYNSFCRKNFFKIKIKINKIISKIDNISTKLSRSTILSITNKMLEEFEYKNLISQFTSQKTRKIVFK